ncbi:MAG TPA: ATP-binding protein [Gemmatimonadaceae bacterium]|jgi:signal transduction histidine kinase
MNREAIRPAGLPTSLRRLRLQLTAWYVGTFFAILTLLGVGLFAAITHRFDVDLDRSLRDAVRDLVATAQSPDRGAENPAAVATETIRVLIIPGRTLYFADTLGGSLTSATIQPWMAAAARAAWLRGSAHTSHYVGDDRILRLTAERFRTRTGDPLIAFATADEIEVEDRYTSLVAGAAAAALISLVLVAGGGWLLGRQTTEPVERAIVHMRRFMADAAHELRTPLTVVRNRAEIALQQPRDPEDYRSALAGIERESVRLSRIVDDLLMLARADTGERPLNRQRVYLDDVTLDAAEAARAIADRKSVRLNVESFEETPIVGDADLLRQLVMILLDNAIKYTNRGGVVRVDVRATSAQATLTVTDTGVGITPEHLPHVFERFYRGDPSRTRNARESGASEGAGLGLSIAQWIADEHGASIRVQSEDGRGTTVVVQFASVGVSVGAPDAVSSV